MSLNKNEKLGVFIAVAAAVLFLVLSLAFFGSPGTVEEDEDEVRGSQEGELLVEDMVEGTGDAAFNGALLTVHYVGMLEDGTQFDSSHDSGEPFQFLLGTNQVIKGWDRGLVGMREGGKRKLTIPPHLGYGSKSAGSIPANSTLIFEVDLLDVEEPQS